MEEEGFDDLARLMEAERYEYNSSFYRWAIGLSNAIIEGWLEEYPLMYVNRAGSYAKLGDFEHAIIDMEKAVELHFMDDPAYDSTVYNNLCWYLGITGQAEKALPHCEEAVVLAEEIDSTYDPAEMVIDSRGLVYGSLEMYEEAIADFERVVAWGEANPELFPQEMLALRQQWLGELQQGNNPFTDETLEQLQAETMDPNAQPEPIFREDNTREHFVKYLIIDNFELADSGVNDANYEYQAWVLEFEGCGNVVVLFGDENEISEVKIMLVNCNEQQTIAEMRWFTKFMLFDVPWADIDDCIGMGEYVAWEVTELEDLVDGKIDETSEFALNQLQFYGERTVNDDGTVIVSFFGW
jgi:tetratricopeptide (TPR) repeat protein